LLILTTSNDAASNDTRGSDLVYESTQIREQERQQPANTSHLLVSEGEREREGGAFSLERRYLNGLQEILSACSVVQRKRWRVGGRRDSLSLFSIYQQS
jgi:hypothetical protein